VENGLIGTDDTFFEMGRDQRHVTILIFGRYSGVYLEQCHELSQKSRVQATRYPNPNSLHGERFACVQLHLTPNLIMLLMLP
jgi:hypothetical protein